MGIGPAEARGLTYWEYSALLQTWNARHDPDGVHEPVAAPADAFVRERQARLAERGISRVALDPASVNCEFQPPGQNSPGVPRGDL